MIKYGIKGNQQNPNDARRGAIPSPSQPMRENYPQGYGAKPSAGAPRGYGMQEDFQPQAAVPQQQAANPQSAAYPTASQPQPAVRPVEPKHKKKRGVGFWVAIIAGIICVILAAILAFTIFGPSKGTRQGDVGQLANKTDAEIQAELDRVVEEGMFNISIASVVSFPTGTSEGELRIENVPGNRYLMRVEITRDDTGDTIYTTDFIEPNHHIQRDALDVALPAGDYPSTAVFYAYDPDTEELVGQAAAKVDIKIEG